MVMAMDVTDLAAQQLLHIIIVIWSIITEHWQIPTITELMSQDAILSKVFTIFNKSRHSCRGSLTKKMEQILDFSDNFVQQNFLRRVSIKICCHLGFRIAQFFVILTVSKPFFLETNKSIFFPSITENTNTSFSSRLQLYLFDLFLP